MNETQEMKVTMNCEIEYGSDAVKNSEAIKRALKWGFEIIGADSQRINLQYVNGHVFDSSPERLAPNLEAVGLPAKSPEGSVAGQIYTRYEHKGSEVKSETETVACCAICGKRVRSDGKPCAGCAQRICSACKVWPQGLCPPCHSGKDNDAPKKAPSLSIKPTPTEKKMAEKPEFTATMCGLCKTKLWAKKCPVCAKGTCGACYDRPNDSCKECASIE